MESLVNGSDGTSNVEVVNQILKLYDSFYQMYVFKVSQTKCIIMNTITTVYYRLFALTIVKRKG